MSGKQYAEELKVVVFKQVTESSCQVTEVAERDQRSKHPGRLTRWKRFRCRPLRKVFN